MTKKVLFTVLISGVIMLSFCELMVLSSMNTQLEHLKSDINYLKNNQNQIVNTTVQTPIEYLVHDIEYSYSDLDTNQSQVNCDIHILLKETADDTKVSLDYNNQIYDLIRENNIFTLTIPVDIFTNNAYHTSTIMVNSNGIQKVQDITLNIDVDYTDLLPMINIVGSVSFSRNQENLYATYKQTWNYSVMDETTFEKIYLVEEINGKQFSKKDMTKAILASDGEYSFNEKITYPMSESKDVLDVYIMAIDSYGYTHYEHVLFRSPNEDQRPKYGYGSRIIDRQGTIVYDTQSLHN